MRSCPPALTTNCENLIATPDIDAKRNAPSSTRKSMRRPVASNLGLLHKNSSEWGGSKLG